MIDKKIKKPILLCILDGWGFGDEKSVDNAILLAKTPNYDRILKQYPFSRLKTSGLDVGLPEGQMGNSEVGHMTIGAGRVIYQDLVRINKAIESEELKKNKDLLLLVEDLKKTKKVVHLCGLFSDGGVHSHLDHIIFLAKFLAENGVKVKIHAFLDGRDVAQKSAIEFFQKFFNETKNYQEKIEFATICGRYYAMDRDKKWDRINLAYDAIVSGVECEKQKEFRKKRLKANDGENLLQLKEAALDVLENYKDGVFDEFILPCVVHDKSGKSYEGVQDGDALIFCNFRADRARQISESLLNPDFNGFSRKKIAQFSHKISIASYGEDLDKLYKILFAPIEVKNSLPEILAKNSLTQLRIAETEKYAHITFFFSCGFEQKFQGEERILIKSPDVTTYDLMPEMSAKKVGEELVKAINSQKFDFIVVNYANADMVGHSGDLQASIKACETIDEQLGILEKEILKNDGILLISADHGNIESMKDENGNVHTSHTLNEVPFIFIGNDYENLQIENGNLSDIAPTIIPLFGLKKVLEMTGKNLISKI